jgi:hypothetical protein
MMDEDSSTNEFMHHDDESVGGEDYNEFIVGSNEYSETPFVGDGVVLGGSGSMMMNCGVALLVVVLIMVFVKMFNKKKHHPRQPIMGPIMRPIMGRPLCNHKTHVDTFDNLLTPPSYFDYNSHGQQYINWTTNN